MILFYFSRNLLLFSLIGVCNVANVASTALCDQCGSSFVEEEVDIVVIGAGMAGLTAAYTIEQKSSMSYVLLEAKDKVGGKMQAAFTDKTGLGITVEDGANWIGGYSPNPMFDLAVEFGLRVFQVDFENFNSFTKNGQDIKTGPITSAIFSFDKAYVCMEEAGQKILDDFVSGTVTPDVSVEKQLAECGFVPKDAIDNFVSWWYIDYDTFAGPKIRAVSSFPDFTQEDFPDTTNRYNEYLVVDKRGYQHVPTKFAETKLLQTPVKNTEVCRVEYDGTGADVETSSTTGTCTRYKAKKVISTISPNIYRFRPDLFDPPLDMSRSPFFDGHYQKVFYKFPTKFWDDTVEFINVVLPVAQRGECGWFQNLDYKRRQQNGQENNRLPDIVDDEMWPASKVLFCLITTDAVDKLGGKITQSIAMTFLHPLKKIFPNSYKDPEAIYIPNWEDDPYSYGPIYWRAGFGLDDYEHYLTQGQPTVHISGSITCRRYNNWVHGAYHAGIRSANIVLDQLGVPGIDTESICDLSTRL